MSRLLILLYALLYVSAEDDWFTVVRENTLAKIDHLILLTETANMSHLLLQRTKTKIGVQVNGTSEGYNIYECSKHKLDNLPESEKEITCCQDILSNITRIKAEAESCGSSPESTKFPKYLNLCYMDATKSALEEFKKFREALGNAIHTHIESLSQRVLADCMLVSAIPVNNTASYTNSNSTESFFQGLGTRFRTYLDNIVTFFTVDYIRGVRGSYQLQ